MSVNKGLLIGLAIIGVGAVVASAGFIGYGHEEDAISDVFAEKQSIIYGSDLDYSKIHYSVDTFKEIYYGIQDVSNNRNCVLSEEEVSNKQTKIGNFPVTVSYDKEQIGVQSASVGISHYSYNFDLEISKKVLDTPSISYANGGVSWKSDSLADHYDVKIGDKSETTTIAYMDLSSYDFGSSSSVIVRSVPSDTVHYVSSEWSDSSFTVNRLSTVTNIKFSSAENKLTWSPVANADSYSIKINSTPYSSTLPSKSFSSNPFQTGDNEVVVSAVPSSAGGNYLPSTTVADAIFRKLAPVSGIDYNGSKITWKDDKNSGCTYLVYVNSKLVGGPTADKELPITLTIGESANISIVAQKDGAIYVPSNPASQTMEISAAYSVKYSYSGISDEFVSSVNNPNPSEHASTSAMLLSNPSCAGYDFVGWFDSSDNPITSVPGNYYHEYSVKGKFTPHTYTIVYKLVHGSSDIIPVTYTIESKDIPLTAPSATGYTFSGWVDESNNPVTKIPHGSVGNKTFTATWGFVTYRINYLYTGIESANTSAIVNSNPTSLNIETPDINLTSATRNGYTFKGWFDSSDNAVSVIRTGTVSDVTIYGKFEPISYSITYDNTKGAAAPVPSNYTIESKDITLSPVAANGYSFNGWVDESNNAITKILHGSTGNRTFTATWGLVTYKINFMYTGISSANAAAIVNTNVKTFTIESSDISLSTPTRQGYTFKGWFDGSNNPVTVITKGTYGDVTVYGKFEPISYSISYGNLKGAASPTPASFTIETPTFSLPSITNAEYHFAGWVNNSNSTAQTKIELGTIGDVSLSATWDLYGSGSTTDPYKIYNQEQLKGITDLTKNYQLQKDITITDGWTPFGSETNKFTGVFDGNNHSLTFSMTVGSTPYFGFMGYLGEAGTITNLTLAGSLGNVSTDVYGSFAAYSYGTISNCTSNVNLTVNGYNSTSGIKVGGIVGSIGGGTITATTNNGAIVGSTSATGALVGGIAGYGQNGLIWECVNKGAVTATATNLAYAGGVMGSRDFQQMTLIGSVAGSTSATNGGTIRAYNATTNKYGNIIGYEDYQTTSGSVGSANRVDGMYYYVTYTYTQWWGAKETRQAWMKWKASTSSFDSSDVHDVVSL
jgi:uncharacterized repeat protein (TIGR02543 family)